MTRVSKSNTIYYRLYHHRVVGKGYGKGWRHTTHVCEARVYGRGAVASSGSGGGGAAHVRSDADDLVRSCMYSRAAAVCASECVWPWWRSPDVYLAAVVVKTGCIVLLLYINNNNIMLYFCRSADHWSSGRTWGKCRKFEKNVDFYCTIKCTQPIYLLYRPTVDANVCAWYFNEGQFTSTPTYRSPLPGMMRTSVCFGFIISNSFSQQNFNNFLGVICMMLAGINFFRFAHFHQDCQIIIIDHPNARQKIRHQRDRLN